MYLIMKKLKFKKVFLIPSLIVFLTVTSLIFYYISTVVFAWVGPTQAPTGGNVEMVDTCTYVFGEAPFALDYSEQADVIYDDYRKSSDSGYTRPLLSTWTQTSTSPEIWQDERTGLYWSAQQGSVTSNSFTIATCDFFSVARGAYTGGDTDCGNAINRCADLNGTTHGGRTGWYLPSQHELMQAYLNGMYIQTSHSFTTMGWYWSSSEVSLNSSRAWDVYLYYGYVYSDGKSSNDAVRCVSRD
jgi:hypothetical protein